MHKKMQKVVVKRLRALMNQGMHRKQAFYIVQQALIKADLPHSQAQIYVWCKKFGVSTS